MASTRKYIKGIELRRLVSRPGGKHSKAWDRLKQHVSANHVGPGEEDGNREKKSLCADGACHCLTRGLKAFFLGDGIVTKVINCFMICWPLAQASAYLKWGDGITFALSLLAIMPFAERLGFVTEQLAGYTNDTIGGLLNASFGNFTELVISVYALLQGRSNSDFLRIVQVSLLGSILSNLLLVLGCAFLFGGIVNPPHQEFNKLGLSVQSGLLMLAVMALVFPAALHMAGAEMFAQCSQSLLAFSRFTSILMLCTYILYLLFQLKTHRHIYDAVPQDDTDPEACVLETKDDNGSGGGHAIQEKGNHEEGAHDEEGDEEEYFGFIGCLVILGLITVVISVLSEILVGAIEGAVSELGLPKLFIAGIIIPIVGNAAEHASGIIFAVKNKMEISIGVAVGSSTQIAVFVIPAMIAAGWVVTAPLSMYFHAYETISLFTTVVAVTFIAMTGRSTWMHGVMLIVAYMIVAAGFYVHRDPVSEELCNMTISVSHTNGTASWTENITESGTGIIPDSP